ncbi:hypothetical protein SARC_02257 [Sphaeroforma arctica JP610]|uniref:Uncharacterized protein n=1 Tax=Sphaeroforma arctica JP610 TaxID=667725 RepID=A0A0L0GBG0_9EUKA|nr:hypothetical protein SARC_02257 [Sphaeroforma arctica JP610]KNC85568.1 hypothetical protein SARC_02257 [Sphaeroforma arctica JP610]|eukprot:XP_014159470.1 hypothetical protein SARC_02257 [Sphaeroforma arctica JP610]
MFPRLVLSLTCLSLTYAAEIVVNDNSVLQTAVGSALVGDAILLTVQDYNLNAQLRLDQSLNISGPGFATPAKIVLGDQALIPFVSTVPFRFAVDNIAFEDPTGHVCTTTETMAQQLSKFNLTSGLKNEVLSDNRMSLHLDMGPWVNRRQVQDITVGECSYKASVEGVTVFESVMMALDGSNCHGFLAIVLDMNQFSSCNITTNVANGKELHVFDVEVKTEDTLKQINQDLALRDALLQKSRGVAEFAVSEDDLLGFKNLLAFRWSRTTPIRSLLRLQGYWRSVGLYDSDSSEAQAFGTSYPSVGIKASAQSTYTDGLTVRANLRTMMIGPNSLAMELGSLYKVEADGTEIEVGEWIVENPCPDQSIGSRCDQTVTTVLRGCDISGNYVLKGLVIDCDKNLDESCVKGDSTGDFDIVLTLQGKDMCVLKTEADRRPYTIGSVEGETSGVNSYRLNQVVRRTLPIKSTAFHEITSAVISNMTRSGINTRTCIPDYFANPGLLNQGFNNLDESVEYNFVASSQFACATLGLDKSEMQVTFNLLVEYQDRRVGGTARRRRRQTTVSEESIISDSITVTYEDNEIDPTYLSAANNYDTTGAVNKVVASLDESGNFTVSEQITIYKGNYDLYIIIGCIIGGIICCLICICLTLICGYVWKTKKEDEKNLILNNGRGPTFDRRGSVDTLQNYMGGNRSNADMFSSRMGSMYSTSGIDNAFANRGGSMYSVAPSMGGIDDNRMSMYSRNQMYDGQSQSYVDPRASEFDSNQSYMTEADRSSGYTSGIPEGERQYFDDGNGPYYVDANGQEVYEDPGAEYYDPNAEEVYYDQGQEMMYDDQGQPIYDDQGQPMYNDEYQQEPYIQGGIPQDEYAQSNTGFSQGQYDQDQIARESYDMDAYAQTGQYVDHDNGYDNGYGQESYEMTSQQQSQPQHYQAGQVYEHGNGHDEGDFPEFASERDGGSPLNESNVDHFEL